MKSRLIVSVLTLFATIAIGSNLAWAQNSKTAEKQTDLQFLDMMTMHHSDGVKMAEMGIGKAQNAGVKTLAEKMAAGQRQDIAEMEKMRSDHFAGRPKAETMMVKGKRMTADMMMKMSQEDMRKLEAAAGTAFDRTFLDVFMKHHRMAIDMSREETSKGRDTEIKKKAGEIRTMQTAELAEMSRLKRQVASQSMQSRNR